MLWDSLLQALRTSGEPLAPAKELSSYINEHRHRLSFSRGFDVLDDPLAPMAIKRRRALDLVMALTDEAIARISYVLSLDSETDHAMKVARLRQDRAKLIADYKLHALIA